MQEKHIAILTLSEDIHAPVIQYALDKYSDVVCDVVHTDRICGNSILSWTNTDDPALSSTILTVEEKPLRISEIDLIWWRRVNYPQKLSSTITDPFHISLIHNDCKAALLGLFMNEFKGIWINDPSATRLAQNKLIQLRAAEHAGFLVPRTLVSNDPRKIREFCKELDYQVVVKPVRGAINCQLYARMLREEHLEFDDALKLSPAIYQEYIPGNKHLRVHCFGDDIYTVLIESKDLDWRENIDIPIHISDCGEAIKDLLRIVLRKLGLKMGVIDLKLSQTGTPVWLEINPQGQFLFAEGLSGLDLTSAFADFLVREAWSC
jgi:Glutathione synthase/Ribosomal protein S6 modification enzyme (glutaminyl transferase)